MLHVNASKQPIVVVHQEKTSFALMPSMEQSIFISHFTIVKVVLKILILVVVLHAPRNVIKVTTSTLRRTVNAFVIVVVVLCHSNAMQ